MADSAATSSSGTSATIEGNSNGSGGAASGTIELITQTPGLARSYLGRLESAQAQLHSFGWQMGTGGLAAARTTFEREAARSDEESTASRAAAQAAAGAGAGSESAAAAADDWNQAVRMLLRFEKIASTQFQAQLLNKQFESEAKAALEGGRKEEAEVEATGAAADAGAATQPKPDA
jgi:hypothetical protein